MSRFASVTRPPHRPPNPHTAAGVALVRSGLTPEDAAEQLREQGHQISGKTIRRAMASSAAPPRREAARAEQPSGRLSSESSTIPTRRGPTDGDPRAAGLGPSLPPTKLADLRDLIGRLPFAQQDHLVATLPLERLRREAIARGIAPYHDAAAAVARSLREVRL